ncbi:MAG: nitrophenyl compound nitroreductase subunit ArsF family protein [Planctomycetota bacterium]|nr:nitrophenyl compound nitroreductase subunit ArsF family protein [Planctomycetota bacterium]
MNRLSWVLAGSVCLALLGCGSGAAYRGVAADPAPVPAKNTRVSVIYMHRTFRCISCLVMEKMARETVQQDFKAALADGTIQWQTQNFWQNEDIARRYGVESPTVVVVAYADGKEKLYQRLDQLWGLKSQPEKFKDAVKKAIEELLREAR